MTVLIDNTMATAFMSVPAREGWVETATPVKIAQGLRAGDIGEDDVALLPVPEATLLTGTHVIDRSVAVIQDGVGFVAMRTLVRPDEIDRAEIHLREVGVSGEVLARALMAPYFGIEATAYLRGAPATDQSDVIVEEGAAALASAVPGHREDLARSWFIWTGKPFVSHVTVVGVRALATNVDEQVDTLRALQAAGWERRRDVRRILREETGVDADALVTVTNRMRFSLEPDDQEPARLLVERGTRGTEFGRSLPAWRDQIGASGTQAGAGHD